jgi:hypothetical protein
VLALVATNVKVSNSIVAGWRVVETDWIVCPCEKTQKFNDMVNMGVEPRTLALLAPRSKPTELIDRVYQVIRARAGIRNPIYRTVEQHDQSTCLADQGEVW